MKIQLSIEAYFLTPNARKAILDDLYNRAQELTQVRQVATTDELRSAIDHELDSLKNQYDYYSNPKACTGGIAQIATGAKCLESRGERP